MSEIGKGKLTIVANKPRYRFLELENHYYLVDTNKDIFTYLFPFIDWFRKLNGIEISKEMADSIQLNPTRQGKGAPALAVGLSTLCTVLLRRIVYLFDFSLHQVGRILIAVMIISMVIALRMFLLANEKKKLDIDFRQYKKIKVRIFPLSLKRCVNAFASYILLLILSLGFFSILVKERDINVVIVIAVFVGFLLLSIMSVFFYANGDYKVTLYDESY